MTLIKQTVELTAPPSDVGHHSGIHAGKDPFHGAECQAIPVSPLDQRYRALIHPGWPSDIDLPESSPQPQRTEGKPEPHSIHRRIMTSTSLPAVI